MFTILGKIFRSGVDLFFREKTITFVSLGTTIISSLFIWSGFFSFYLFNQMINYLKERLDFSIYFKPTITPDEISKIQKILQNFPEVIEVSLVTQEEALEKFKKEAKNNPVISRALSEININPMVDYLIVKASSPETYPKIIDYLEKSPYKSYIDYISYFENQKVIGRVISLSNKLRFLVSFFILFTLLISALTIFNVVLVSIYSQKESIEVLRLIGASNFFIRGPFMVYSFLFTFVGHLFFLVALIFFLEKTANFWPGIVSNFQPASFLFENFFLLNGISFGIILLINWLGTFFALEKYLKI